MRMREKFTKMVARIPGLYRLLKRIYDILQHLKLRIRSKRIKGQKSFTHLYSVKEIIMQQNQEEGYNRLDIIVRLLAIENEDGLNDFGWDLYRKMQEKRVGKEEVSVSERVRAFKELIYSWEANGYNSESLILVDNNLMLDDGSHRLALAIYHGLDKINCRVLPMDNNRDYGVKWFIENDFTESEVKLILKKAEEVIDANKIIISCILWPPVKEYFDEIVGKLSLIYKIVETKDMSFSSETFDQFVQDVYQIDDIEQWKIDKKKQCMKEAPEKAVRLITLEFSTPQFRHKALNHNLILMQGEQLKKMIRNCYKEKINDYFYDIICHTGDNQEQSDYIIKLFYPTFSLYK